jgi:ArsR family transcriptional regulator
VTGSTDFGAAAGILKTLGHPVRLKIVCGLLGEPATLSRIARDLGVPVSTLAQHLAVLRRGAILEEERRGVEVVFRVADRRVPAILCALCSPKAAQGRLPRWSWRDLARARQAVEMRR